MGVKKLKKYCIQYSEKTDKHCAKPVSRGEEFYCRLHKRPIPHVQAYTNSRVLKRTEKKVASLIRRHKRFYLDVRGESYYVDSHGYMIDLRVKATSFISHLT